MSDITLPQEDADALIQMEKRCVGPSSYTFPQPGRTLEIECQPPDGSERFHLDIYRGSINLKKVSQNFRARTSIVLLRLDVDTAPHRNPDGEKIGRTHLHVYREGYGDSWAYEIPGTLPEDVPALRLGDLTDRVRTLRDFMRYCNIVDLPTINSVLL